MQERAINITWQIDSYLLFNKYQEGVSDKDISLANFMHVGSIESIEVS